MEVTSKVIEFDFGADKSTIEVFSDGCIVSKGKVLNQYDNGAGYLSVRVGNKFSAKGEKFSVLRYVHRLVAECFIPNPDNLPQVNHKDCNKSNNSVDNLEWISKAENIQHSHASGRMEKRYKIGTINILSVDEVIECYTRVKNGEGVNAVAVSMGKPRTTISSIMNKRSRRDITDKIDQQLAALNPLTPR